MIKCSCGEVIEFPAVPKHKQESCPNRNIICRFCHLLVEAGKISKSAKDLYLGTGLTEHESECGSRTIICVKCSKPVQLKDVNTHFQLHEIQNKSKVYNLCSNEVCGNLQSEQFPNPLILCPPCYKQFYSPRYDQDNQKIMQKIIQTYHHQLTIGCKTGYCINIYCCTSKNTDYCHEPLEPNDSALKSIELFKSGFSTKKRFYFCVQNEKNALRRTNASVMHQRTGKNYDACVAALYYSNDNEDAALSWLNKNA